MVDAETGRPLQYVQVSVESLRLGAQTDLDGRFTIRAVPVGPRVVFARLIGFKASRIENVAVVADQATVVNVALSTAPRQLQGIVVTADVEQRTSSEAGMLAMQKAAPSVSDGISAEAMSRTPTANAADAITRVTGVSVVDNRFVVVRGLGERYSNTLLNGAELPSPEPTKKVVPLDIFPASLLESVVTTKTATPDRPADFSGGSVEIKTKEFPENRVAQVSITAAFDLGLPDDSVATACATLRVIDAEGNSSDLVEQRLLPDAGSAPEATRFNAVFSGQTILRTTLVAADADGDYAGVFVGLRFRDGALGAGFDGKPDYAILNTAGYPGVGIPEIALGGLRPPFHDYVAVILYLIDRAGHVTRLEDANLFQ